VKSDKRQVADAEELAALYVSGAMSAEEQRAFQAALSAGNQDLIRHVKELEPAAAALAGAAEPVQPSASVRDSLLRKIARTQEPAAETAPSPRRQVWRQWKADDPDNDLFTLRADQGAWEETGVAGVRVRRLFVDRQSNRMTAMFRMEPGTSYPEHVHDGPEECYVLEGDLHVGDEFVMRKGDYQRALPGSEHGVQWTENGCLLLVTCSLSDEMS
jgi:anti-sigma factor ChrR (cupin superfamily)